MNSYVKELPGNAPKSYSGSSAPCLDFAQSDAGPRQLALVLSKPPPHGMPAVVACPPLGVVEKPRRKGRSGR